MANLKLKENLDIKSTGVSTSGQNALPKTGDIIPFAGTVAPTGWAICDGTSGTPDLRGYFIVGSASSANIGATYGNTNHTHTTSVGAYGIDNAIASETHGYNAIASGISGNASGPNHSHNSPFSTTSDPATSNLIANSNNVGGPISFVPRPHSHTQSHLVSAATGGTSNHRHNGGTVNMSTGGSHSAGHSIGGLSGNLTDPGKQYQPFIIMNYIMKV
jgi:microcystin-dependent protein